jgi:hypothetical protein
MKEKKRGKKFNIHISLSNRWLYTLIVLGVLAAIAVGVYAVAGSVPSPGHPLSELQACSDGQALVSNSSGDWICSSVGGSEDVEVYINFPPSPSKGDYYVEESSNTLYVYAGSETGWIRVGILE